MSISSQGEARNIRGRNHNGNMSTNQSGNRALPIFTDEVLSVGVKLDNPTYIISFVRYLNNPYAHVDIDNPIKLSKEET